MLRRMLSPPDLTSVSYSKKAHFSRQIASVMGMNYTM